MHLRIVAESYFAMTFVDKISGHYVLSGSSGDVIKEAAKRMNFSYSVLRSSDGIWGLPLPNGSWSGMIGMFLRNESDLSPGPFAVTPEREKVFDYTIQLKREYASILYVINTKARTDNKLDYFLTVDTIVWILLIFNTIDICLLISYPLSFKIFFRNLFSSFEALLMGSFNSRIPINKTRKTLLYLFILMTCLLRININALYGVNLVLSNNNEQINSIEDLANSRTFIPVIRNNSSFELFFKFANTENYRKIWQRMDENKRKSFIPNANAIETDKLIQRIIDGESAYMDILIGLRTLSSEICNRMINAKVCVAKQFFRDLMLSFAFRKGFNPSFQRAFNQLLLKFQENGVYEYWWQKELIENNVNRLGFFTQNLECFHNAWKTSDNFRVSNSFEALKVEEMRFAFCMVLCGFMLSIIIVFMEIMFKYFVQYFKHCHKLLDALRIY